MQKKIPSKWGSLYGDWCKICRYEKTERCKECSVNEKPCSISNEWAQISQHLNPIDYFKVLFHQCLRCVHLEIMINSEGLWIKNDNKTEICYYMEKEENEK